MKVLILDTTEDAIERAARLVSGSIMDKPNATLGLATGGTMVPLYRLLRDFHKSQGLSFAQLTTFNLDEYVGLSPDHPASYHSYMRDVLFDHVDVDQSNTFLPRGDSADLQAECDDYEQKIAASGGINLQLLGIGQNGHIGFNEPTSSLGSRTRIKTLTAGTLTANRSYFADDTELPKYALTMGIGTILDAQHCVMLATGASKASAVSQAVEGPVSAVCPASALQLHNKVTVILDRAAASELKLVDYYHHVHPAGAQNEFE